MLLQLQTQPCGVRAPLLTWIKTNHSTDKKQILGKIWDEITYPFPNFNGCAVWEWINNFIRHFIITYAFHGKLYPLTWCIQNNFWALRDCQHQHGKPFNYHKCMTKFYCAEDNRKRYSDVPDSFVESYFKMSLINKMHWLYIYVVYARCKIGK